MAPTNYCGLDGDIDLESARRTGQAYIYSGNWNPAVNPTKHPRTWKNGLR